MAEQFERLVTVWDANFQKLDEKLNKINARHHAVTRQMKKDADTFTSQLEKRYGAAGQAFGNVINDSRLAVLDAGASRLRVFGSALEPLGGLGLASAAGIAALAAAAGQAQQAMAFADEIDDASQKLNIGATALQEYRFAMTEAGGEAKDADEAIAGFNKTLGLAQSGLSPKAMKGFAALGFTPEQLQSFNSGEEALSEVARRVADLSKESERAAVVEKLGLGPMLPLLREGSARMEDLRQRAHEMGIVMDEDLVKKGADANQQFETMAEVIKVQMASAFVGLSDEVVAFTANIADALEGLNAFIERYNQWKQRADISGDSFDQTERNMARGPGPAFGLAAVIRNRGRAFVRGITGQNLSQAEIDAQIERERQARLPLPGEEASSGDGNRLRPTPAGRSGGRGGANRAEQRERRQEQFERELERVQAELIRSYDHEFESIRSDTANKLAQLQHAHQMALQEIVRREEEYIRSDGQRGLAKAEADQLRAAEDLLYATAESRTLTDERIALERYRLQQEEEASRLTLQMLGIQQDMALTARERHELSLQALAEEHRIARERDRAELANDPNMDEGQRQAALNQRDAARSAAYDAQKQAPVRDSLGDLLGGWDAFKEGVDGRLEALAEMYAEIDRMRQANELSEEEAARARAAVDMAYREQRLENTRTMLDTLAQLQGSSNKKLAALGKAAAIAQATIDGYLAVQKALAAFPPPFNYVQAAIVGAVTASNIAAIAGVGFERGGYTGNGGTKQVAGVVHGQEYVFDAAATRRIGVGNLEALRNGASMISGLNGAAVGMAGLSGGGSTMTFAPTIHAPGADMAAVRRIEQALDEQARNFQRNWKNAAARNKRFGMGGSR